MADEVERRQGQEGSRWVNQRPTGEELAAWFKTNVPMHEGMDPADYVQGLTLIPNTEKGKEVIAFNPQGEPVIAERTNLVYTPYAKVETRVKYFWDLMAENPEWLGVIEPVRSAKGDASGFPIGFYPLSLPDKEGTRSFICCTMKVTVYKRDTVEWTVDRLGQGRAGNPDMILRRRQGETIIDAPPATKMISAMGRWGADEFALMKAETGAVGRALGLAGMLVIPGTGVATAEDVQEAHSIENAPPKPPEDSTASVPAQDERSPQEILTTLRQEAATLINSLKNDHPEAFAPFREWAAGRGIGRVDEINDDKILRGLITKARNTLEEAEAASTDKAD